MRRFLLLIIMLISCAENGEIGIVEVSVEPDPSHLVIDENLEMKVCSAKIKLEERGGVGVYFIGERINYIDMKDVQIFHTEVYDENGILEKYGYNYLPPNSSVEIEIKDMVSTEGPDNFYVEDTVYCRDIKGNYFEVYYKRTCLSSEK